MLLFFNRLEIKFWQQYNDWKNSAVSKIAALKTKLFTVKKMFAIGKTFPYWKTSSLLKKLYNIFITNSASLQKKLFGIALKPRLVVSESMF